MRPLLQSYDFSLIIPAFNARDTIRDSIESILRQRFDSVEVVIIDDGSTDDTADICRNTFDELGSSSFKYIYQENQGAAAARNKGLDSATGNWILFLDADDLLPDQTLETVLKDESKLPQVDIFLYSVQLQGIRRDEKLDFVEKNTLVDESTKHILMEAVAGHCSEPSPYKNCGQLGLIGGTAYRRDFIYQNELRFDEKIHLHEDQLFKLTAIAKARAIYVSKGLGYQYVQRNDSYMSRYSPKKETGILRYLDEMKSFLLEEGLGNPDLVRSIEMHSLLEIITGRCRLSSTSSIKTMDDVFEHEAFADITRVLKSDFTGVTKQLTFKNRLIMQLALKRMTKLLRTLIRIQDSIKKIGYVVKR